MSNDVAIAVFAYSRDKHLAACLKNLVACTLFSECDLYLYIDLFPDGQSGQEKVFDVVSMYEDNCKKVTVSDKNKGLAASVVDGVSELFDSYEKVIVIEDDIVVTRDFLPYMLSNFDVYRDEFRIGSISGFGFDLSNDRPGNYFHCRPSSWAWGTWRSRWEQVNWKEQDFLVTGPLRLKLKYMGDDVCRMLNNYKRGRIDSWAIRWAYFHAKNDWLVSYPYVSRADNIGFGDDATHCKGENIYPCILSKEVSFEGVLKLDLQIVESERRAFNWYNSNVRKLTIRIKRLIAGCRRES